MWPLCWYSPSGDAAHARAARPSAATAVLAVAGCGSDSNVVRPVKSSGQTIGAAVKTVAATPATASTTASKSASSKPPPRPSGCPRRPIEQLVTSRRWLSGFEITEYFSVPERWFVGRRVRAPGIPGRHRVDWLYSSNGGWFVATDTGGAIIGRHIDVYRPPTGSIDDGGRYMTHRRVYVVPPGTG